MNVINDLLKSTPQQTQKTYQSYLQTHLKLLMTNINKAKAQNITHIQIRKNKCIQQCYNNNLQQLSTQNQNKNTNSIYDIVDQIRQCKQRCGQQKKAIKKYLDDINYYSSLKLERCSSECIGDQYSKQFNVCMWDCYNRLDRRYKKYWVQQRVKIQNRFYPNANTSTTAS